MKTKAVISLLDATQSGISKSTGNPWVKKECVIELCDETGHRDTLAVQTMSEQVVKVLEGCVKGDEVVMDLGFNSRARVFLRKDGSEGVIRQTEVYVKSVEVVKPAAY